VHRSVFIISVGLLVASSLAFAAALYCNSSENWAPVCFPLPAPGVAVEVPFEIATQGTFHFEASVPKQVPAIAIEELPVVACRLVITFTSDTSPLSQSIVLTSFRAAGHDAFDQYDARQEVRLNRGRYTLVVRNVGLAQPFRDRGAMLTLTRFVHPTEFYLRGVLLRGAGWLGLVSGVAVAAFAARPRLGV
jgi:hypothetical protein